jgi:hypothetical protein
MAEGDQSFGSILLAGRSGTVCFILVVIAHSDFCIWELIILSDNLLFFMFWWQLQGNLRFTGNGITWKKSGGGRTVDIPQKGTPLLFQF